MVAGAGGWGSSAGVGAVGAAVRRSAGLEGRGWCFGGLQGLGGCLEQGHSLVSSAASAAGGAVCGQAMMCPAVSVTAQ